MGAADTWNPFAFPEPAQMKPINSKATAAVATNRVIKPDRSRT